jgi:hypothetical protein
MVSHSPRLSVLKMTPNWSLGPSSRSGTWSESLGAQRISEKSLFPKARNMETDVRLQSFISYRTSHYKLHYYETPTSLKFVMVTDTKTNNLRIVLHQIYVSLYVEYGECIRELRCWQSVVVTVIQLLRTLYRLSSILEELESIASSLS